MPILKKTDPIPRRPIIILLFGEPGIGKTSVANTGNEPLLIDFDRGSDRAINRQDTLIVRSWEDVETEQANGTFKNYKTIVIDTAKSALDDFLMAYVLKKDIKNRKNKQAAYGAIGDEFKLFVNQRRLDSADLVIIAHAKNEKSDGDNNRKIPDVTGGSFQLLLRIADQIGYVSTTNNQRTIQFDPTDNNIGKNVARLTMMEIPNETHPGFKTFMADLIEQVKESMTAISEAQKEAIEKFERMQKEIEECQSADDLTMIVPAAQQLPEVQKQALLKLIGEKSKAKKYVWDKAAAKFNEPPAEAGENKLNGKASEKIKEELPFS